MLVQSGGDVHEGLQFGADEQELGHDSFVFIQVTSLSTIGLQSDLKYLTRLGTLGIRLIRRFSAPSAQVKRTFLVGLPVELHFLEGPE